MTKRIGNLAGKTVLITGASSGLGEQIAYEASKAGARVVLCARRIDKLIEIAGICEEYSQLEAYFFTLDISDFDDVESKFKALKAENFDIDVLVNCAGFGLFEPFLETKFSDTKQMFLVNVLGLMYITQKIGIQMAERGCGHIINVASQAGKMATPKSSIYAATKFAVIGFSNSLRLEMKPLGISVTTVNPGPIKTPFFDLADPSGTYLKSIDKLALDPQKLAKKIVKAMGTNKREINSPYLMEIGSKSYQLFPHIGDFLAGTIFNKK
ncbi:SDR family NAD(P)-dependent oxidoreductase [Vagococcus hydrophili]|uniref:SDR family oxidoreductase n=1 Tax=Vagococcus hydrophili TaxID=2714947 RepID=A0A6G8AUZ6_9ENTE|nr:SDR family oxidoreductase [Vagococcus hydrophili]QIL48884.1 SDR family oxidoreductase [Vagococcus hydrophili]